MAESEYELDYFKTEGFTRNRCKGCGRFFWARGERELCGEAPCIEYSFIGNPPTKKSMDVHETREMFLAFMEKHGHTRVNRYPITARWRDDVFFTQASIYGFQPWVVKGVVEPPANPLTISQTCVRFNDIDNVGRTGSHFTMFEMMAHHAFNSESKFVYFKDWTVELCDRLMREELGIGSTELAYVEADWVGGGNSGPCFEVMAGGVELCTLVFMMYENAADKRVPLPMQVVDTGYGLERIAWLSQGTSSAYEAVFGPVLSFLKEQAGAKGDDETLSEYSKVAGLLNLDNPGTLRELRKKVADRLGIKRDQLLVETLPLENIYVVCDHSRALTFMLNDGVVPSNVKSGYFARLLVRRAMRSLNWLRLDLSLADIVDRQIAYFKDDFPELAENRDGILGLVDVETMKYQETLRKGSSLVSRMEEDLKAQGKGIGVEELIELYDSHGLNPEVVADFASETPEIPDDFYQQVAARHAAIRPEVQDTEEQRLDVEKTVLGFYEDPLVRKFEAKVLYVNGTEIVLDKTYFYAEGGGQEADTGHINDFRVKDVQSVGNVIIHYLDTKEHDIKVGDVVRGRLDWVRRRQLMRHHTATHIINAAAREVLGMHIWQTGAHKSMGKAHLDITHYAGLTDEQFRAIEERANMIVMEDIPVISKPMDRVKAEAEFGMRLYQGGAVPGKVIRVVNILDVDVEACGGIHCTRTSEVGPIKLLRSKRIQDGVVRLEFIAGAPLYDWMLQRDRTIAELADIMGVQDNELVGAVRRTLKEHGEMSKAKQEVMASATEGMVREALDSSETISGIRFIDLNVKGPMKQATEVSKSLSQEKGIFAIITSSAKPGGMLLTSSEDIKLDCGQVAFDIARELNGAGGGKGTFAQLSLPGQEEVHKAKAMIRQRLESL
jgi:alanyl-tRNA synthetase